MKGINHIFYSVLIFILIDIKRVHSSYQPYTLEQSNHYYDNQHHIQPVNYNQQSNSQRQQFVPIECDSGANGLFAHPLNCGKFLNCYHGRTFIQQCQRGTLFNDVTKVCDWPHKVKCDTRDPSGNAYFGGGQYHKPNIFVHNQNPPPHHHHYQHNQQGEPKNTQIHQQHIPIPASSHHYQSNSDDFIVNYETTTKVPVEAATKTQSLNIPAQDLLPPFDDGALPNNRFNQLDGVGDANGPVGEDRTQPEEIDSKIFTIPTEPHIIENIAPEPIPELNYMTSIVSDEFKKYFSNPKPKSPPKTDSQLKQEHVMVRFIPHDENIVRQLIPELNYMTLQVGGEFNKYFLNPKPKSIPKLPSSSSNGIGGRIETNEAVNTNRLGAKDESLAESNIDNVILAPHSLYFEFVRSHRFPELNMLTSYVGKDFIRYFSNPKPKSTPTVPLPSSSIDSQSKQQETTQQTPYFIPDMSLLPLEADKYPKNTYPETNKRTISSSGAPSRGGDIPLENFDVQDNPQTVDTGKNEGDVVLIGKKGLLHGESKQNTDRSTPESPIAQISSTTERQNVIKDSSVVEPLGQSISSVPSVQMNAYSHDYYQRFTRLLNDTEAKNDIDRDYIPISDNLKILLRPFMARNDGKTAPNQIHNGQNSKETPESVLPNENVGVRNLPDSPITYITPEAELIATTTERKHIEVTTSKKASPVYRFRLSDQNGSHFHPGSQHTFEFNPQHQQRPNNKPKMYDQNAIFFPGPHSESHPMYKQTN